MKKRISLIMAAIMSMCIFAQATALAADITVPAKTLISHDFTQDTACPQGWTEKLWSGATSSFSGGWNLATGSRGYMLSPEYDAAGAAYTISAEFKITQQNKFIYFGNDYKVNFNGDTKGNQTTTLYKGTEQLAQTTETKQKWSDKAEVVIDVALDAITVSVDGVQWLSYNNAYTDDLSSGTVKFESSYQATTLYSISVVTKESILTAEDTGASVIFDVPSRTLMSHDFTQDTSMPTGWEEYKAEDMTGYTFDNGLYITQTNRYLRITSPNEYNAKGKPYTITVNHSLTYGSYYTYFAVQDLNKYYVKIEGSNAENRYVELYKVTTEVTTQTTEEGVEEEVRKDTHTLLAKSENVINSGVWQAATTLTPVEVKIVVGLESIDVYVKDVLMLSYANTYDSSVQSGKIAIQNGYQAYRLYDFSVATNPTTAQSSDFLINRTFTTEDTKAALTSDGWTVTTHSNDISGNGFAATTLQYDAKISGNYTVEMNSYKAQNNTDIYLRYDPDTKTGYAVRSRMSSGNYVSFGKIVNGTYNEIQKYTTTKQYDKPTATFTATIEDVGDDVKLTLRVVYGNQDNTWEWTDIKSDTNEPIKTAGGFAVLPGDKWSAPYVNSVKAYPTTKGERTIEDVQVRYYVDNNLVDEFTEGQTYVNMPTAVLGESFTIIAALYDNGVMKDVKIVNAEDAYEFTGAELFDTTGVSENAYIATYIWKDLGVLQPLKQAALLQ